MTDEELQALHKHGEKILELAKREKRYEIRKDLHEQYDAIVDRIAREQERREPLSLADHYRAKGLNPYSPCPTCGQALEKK